MSLQRGVSCLRRVTIPVRVKRRWTHHLRRSLKVGADSDGSIALAAIRHRRCFRGCASGAREYKSTDYFIFSRKIFVSERHIFMRTGIALSARENALKMSGCIFLPYGEKKSGIICGRFKRSTL